MNFSQHTAQKGQNQQVAGEVGIAATCIITGKPAAKRVLTLDLISHHLQTMHPDQRQIFNELPCQERKLRRMQSCGEVPDTWYAHVDHRRSQISNQRQDD